MMQRNRFFGLTGRYKILKQGDKYKFQLEEKFFGFRFWSYASMFLKRNAEDAIEGAESFLKSNITPEIVGIYEV